MSDDLEPGVAASIDQMLAKHAEILDEHIASARRDMDRCGTDRPMVGSILTELMGMEGITPLMVASIAIGRLAQADEESPMPKRIQRLRKRGWRAPKGAAYVGRPSKWGNPWVFHGTHDLSRSQAAEAFRMAMTKPWSIMRCQINGRHMCQGRQSCWYPTRADIRQELAGRDLMCWCPMDQPCHADTLLAIANSTTETNPERNSLNSEKSRNPGGRDTKKRKGAREGLSHHC